MKRTLRIVTFGALVLGTLLALTAGGGSAAFDKRYGIKR